jgi:phosphoribosylglycinamide formyltransferase-1
VVDAGVDTGPILAQAVVPVQQGDEPDALHRRIQVAEHALLPAVVHAVATGDLELSPTPRLRDPEALRGPEGAALYSPPLVAE